MLLPGLLPRWIAAWIVSFLILQYGFQWIKPRVRLHALRVDDRVRAWVRGLRFLPIPGASGIERPDAEPPEAETQVEDLPVLPPTRERVPLTWFFRFWTNFASAPSLCLLSLAVPLYAYYHSRVEHTDKAPLSLFNGIALWLLPGLCYSGSMLLSYILKRVFKRLRPPIEKGAFGHKLLRDPSFPSGHSLTSFSFWIMMVLSLASFSVPALTLTGFALLGITIVGLTGLSRIYLGVHFPSDVVGGYIIGLVWTSVCYIVVYSALAF